MVKLEATFRAAEGITPDLAAEIIQRASRYEAITELTVIVWFADGLTFVKLNLVIVLIVIHLIYIFARMVRSTYE